MRTTPLVLGVLLACSRQDKDGARPRTDGASDDRPTSATSQPTASVAADAAPVASVAREHACAATPMRGPLASIEEGCIALVADCERSTRARCSCTASNPVAVPDASVFAAGLLEVNGQVTHPQNELVISLQTHAGWFFAEPTVKVDRVGHTVAAPVGDVVPAGATATRLQCRSVLRNPMLLLDSPADGAQGPVLTLRVDQGSQCWREGTPRPDLASTDWVRPGEQPMRCAVGPFGTPSCTFPLLAWVDPSMDPQWTSDGSYYGGRCLGPQFFFP